VSGKLLYSVFTTQMGQFTAPSSQFVCVRYYEITKRYTTLSNKFCLLIPFLSNVMGDVEVYSFCVIYKRRL